MSNSIKQWLRRVLQNFLQEETGDEPEAGITIKRDANLRGGYVAGRDITIYGHYEGPPPTDDEEAQSVYLGVIARRCGDIPLSGLDRSADDAESRYQALGLEKVYIDLDTQTVVSDKAITEAMASGKPLKMDRQAMERSDDSRPLAALETAALNHRLVLLGDPGGGKTTFVNRLCLALAKNEWEDSLARWPESERNCLPILVILRDFARWLGEQETPIEADAVLLWRYVLHDLASTPAHKFVYTQ